MKSTGHPEKFATGTATKFFTAVFTELRQTLRSPSVE